MKNNKNLKSDPREKTFKTAVEEHLNIKYQQVSDATYDVLCRKARQLIRKWGKKKLVDINATDIEMYIAKLLKRLKGNTVNQYIDIMRQVFNRAYRDGIIKINPMCHVKNCRFEVVEPQPFLQSEIQLFIAHQHINPIGAAIIQVGISTGLRISELLAISREAIDLDKRTLRVDLALVDGCYKTPKTKSSCRTVELTVPAVQALRTLLEHARHRKEKAISVMCADNRTRIKLRRTLLAYYPDKRRQYTSVDEFREDFFEPFCATAGVAYRGPSQFRHTYASQLLSAGVNIEWIAKQMGHTSTAMIRRHYGKWLVEDAADFKTLAENALARCFRLNETQALVPANNSELDMTKLIADPQIQQYLLGLVAQSMKNIHIGEPHSQSD
ncbi:TPA: tyrosine-type recombinase/integrase [Aeromonas salmonicida subsp. pectinolytica]